MNKAVPWSIKGVDFDAREAAKEAARRSGLTLGEWINSVIADQAAELGVEPADIDSDTRLEAVAAKLARLTHRDLAAPPVQRRMDRPAPDAPRLARHLIRDEPAPRPPASPVEDDRDSRDFGISRTMPRRTGDFDGLGDRHMRDNSARTSPVQQNPARRPAEKQYREAEPARDDDDFDEPFPHQRPATPDAAHLRPPVADPEALLSAAIDKFDERTRDSQKKTATALAKVAQWIETSEMRRDGERDALDKVAERLNDIQSQVSRRDSQRDTFARDALNKVANRLEDLETHVVQRGGEEQQPVRQALARMETRLDALSRRPAHAPEVETSLRDIDGKIAALNNRLEKGASDAPRAEQMQRLEARVSSLVETLASRVKSEPVAPEPKPQAPAIAAAPRAPLAKPSVNDAIAAIARRQRALDETPAQPLRQPGVATTQPVLQSELDRRLEAIAARLERSAHQAQAQIQNTQTRDASALSGLQGEIASLSARLEDMRHDSARAASKMPDVVAPPNLQLTQLRQDIADMAATLANLAPRGSVADLETAMRDLARRIEVSRDGGAREALLAPIEQLAGDLRHALTELDPRASLEALHREIHAINRKVEGMTGRGLDRESFERVQAQSQEIRDLLAAAIVRPLPIDTIERQIVALAERIEQISDQGRHAPAQKPDLSGIAAEIKSIIDRALPRAALQTLEHRLEALDGKIDEAISRSQGSHHLAELALRMDDVQRALSKPQASGPDMRPLEQMMRDMSARFDSASLASATASASAHVAADSVTGQSLQALENQLSGIAARLERSHQGLADKASSHFDTLSQRMDVVSQKVAQQAFTGATATVDQGALEAMLRDLSDSMAAVRRPDASMQVLQAVETQLGRIAERLERSNHGLSVLSSDTTTKLDSLSKHIDTVQAGVARQLEAARAAPMVAPNSNVAALEGMVRSLSEKIDAARSPNASLSAIQALETQVARMAERMESARAAVPAGPSPEVVALEAMMRALAAKFEAAQAPQASQQASAQALEALESQVVRIADRLERSDNGLSALGSLERSVGELFNQIEESRHATIDAAENAARTATRDTMREAMRNVPSQPSPELARELASVRSQQDEADRRTHSTLSAVHQTLEKVVDRLAMLETEVVDSRQADVVARSAPVPLPPANWIEQVRPPVAATQDSAPFAATRAAVAQSRAAPADAAPAIEPRLPSTQMFDDDDFLIEPGHAKIGNVAHAPGAAASGLARGKPEPRRAAARDHNDDMRLAETRITEIRAADHFEGDAEAPAVAVSDKSAQQNFIAAARRAAQAAAVQSVADINAPRFRSEAAKASTTAGKAAALAKISLISSASGYIQSRKRSLFVIGMSLLLVFGTVALIRTLDIGGRGAVKSAEANKDVKKPLQASSDAAPGLGAPSLAEPGAAAQIPASPARPREGASLEQGAARPKLANLAPGVDPGPDGTIAAVAPRGAEAGQSSSDTGHDLMQLAQSGNAAAQFEAGARLVEGRGMARDVKAAAAWFEKAAGQGLAPAQYRYGTLLEKGIGVARDIAQAKDWYQRAADQGHGGAMHNLAVLVADGNGGKPDYAGAKLWFSNAAEHGVRDSQYNLAILFARGLGTPQDLVKSYVWFTLAANQGDEDAAKKRSDVASRLDNGQMEQAKAAIAAFKPQPLDPAFNEVAPPPGGWDAVARKPEPPAAQKDSIAAPAKPVAKTSLKPKG